MLLCQPIWIRSIGLLHNYATQWRSFKIVHHCSPRIHDQGVNTRFLVTNEHVGGLETCSSSVSPLISSPSCHAIEWDRPIGYSHYSHMCNVLAKIIRRHQIQCTECACVLFS